MYHLDNTIGPVTWVLDKNSENSQKLKDGGVHKLGSTVFPHSNSSSTKAVAQKVLQTEQKPLSETETKKKAEFEAHMKHLNFFVQSKGLFREFKVDASIEGKIGSVGMEIISNFCVLTLRTPLSRTITTLSLTFKQADAFFLKLQTIRDHKKRIEASCKGCTLSYDFVTKLYLFQDPVENNFFIFTEDQIKLL